MVSSPAQVARNGIISGVASVAAAAATRAAISNPTAALIVSTGVAIVAYTQNDAARAEMNSIAHRARDAIGEPNNPNSERNRANAISNVALLTGIAASVATGNPTFALTGSAIGTGAQAIRAATHLCTIL